jgi:hypothetical protein
VLAQEDMFSLVDEATGYRQAQEIQELRVLLANSIPAVLRPWLPKFPNEFFQQLYRLHHWQHQPGLVERANSIGRFIHTWIYEHLSPEIIEALAQGKHPLEEKGAGIYRLHPFVSEPTSIPDLDKQLTTLIVLMRISTTRDELEAHLQRAFLQPVQERLTLVVETHQPRLIQGILEFPAS